jgi:hypothetical protein
VPSDGVDYLPLDSAVAGTLVLSVVAVDALDQASADVEEQAVFLPPLEVAAAAAAEVVGGAVALNVSASVLDGASPFDWTVLPGAPATNGSAGAGTLCGAGTFGWNATYRTEGSLGVTVAVVDADGISAVTNLSVVLAPTLSVAAGVEPAGPGAVTLTMTISGGIGPFAYRWNDSTGDLWNGTEAGAGTLVLRETTDASGPCAFGLLVVDELGYTASSRLRVSVAPAVPIAVANSVLTTAAVILAVVVTAAAAALLLRRRHPVTAPRPPDPIAVLRETIEPSDGVDRGVVELLAEERGIPLEVVRTTLERLKADGTVRAGRGPDGEEVLAWSEPALR